MLYENDINFYLFIYLFLLFYYGIILMIFLYCFVHYTHPDNEKKLVLIQSDTKRFKQTIGQLVDIQDSFCIVFSYFPCECTHFFGEVLHTRSSCKVQESHLPSL